MPCNLRIFSKDFLVLFNEVLRIRGVIFVSLYVADSWVDLSSQMGTTTPPLIAASSLTPRSPATPPFGGENDYLRMLREAQRESNRSSNKVSPISSALMSLTGTPKRASPIDS